MTIYINSLFLIVFKRYLKIFIVGSGFLPSGNGFLPPGNGFRPPPEMVSYPPEMVSYPITQSL